MDQIIKTEREVLNRSFIDTTQSLRAVVTGTVNAILDEPIDTVVTNTVTVTGTVNAILDEPIDVTIVGQPIDTVVTNTVTVTGTVNAVLDEPIDVNITSGGTDNGLAISKGLVEDSTFVHKFGNAPRFDVDDGWTTIWDGSDSDTLDQQEYIYSTTADIDSISSASTADTQLIQLQGVDGNYELITQTITLNGQNRVALTIPLLRVFRMKNADSVDLLGNVYCYVNTSITNGIPDDSTKGRAMILIEANQTLMAIYTVPAGYTGYLRSWYASTSGAIRDSVHVIHLHARPIGGVWQLKHISSISVTGTSYIQHRYIEPEKFVEKVDIEIHANTDQNNASIGAGFDLVLVKN